VNGVPARVSWLCWLTRIISFISQSDGSGRVVFFFFLREREIKSPNFLAKLENTWTFQINSDTCFLIFFIQGDSKRWAQLNSKWRLNTRQTVGCGIRTSLLSLYGLTCVGYAQNSLEFVSRSTLTHVVGRSFCLYTDSLFAQICDSKDKCSSSLEVECWNEDETHAAQQSLTQF